MGKLVVFQQKHHRMSSDGGDLGTALQVGPSRGRAEGHNPLPLLSLLPPLCCCSPGDCRPSGLQAHTAGSHPVSRPPGPPIPSPQGCSQGFSPGLYKQLRLKAHRPGHPRSRSARPARSPRSAASPHLSAAVTAAGPRGRAPLTQRHAERSSPQSRAERSDAPNC